MIELRAHHLLCRFGWRGQGYNRAFVDNFNDLDNRLDDETLIKLVAGVDAVCAACPNLDGDDCTAPGSGEGEVAGSIDLRVMERLGVRAGELYTYGQLVERIHGSIEPGDLSIICRSCSWLSHGWCVDGLSAARSSNSRRTLLSKR